MSTDINNSITGSDSVAVSGDGIYNVITGRRNKVISNGKVISAITGREMKFVEGSGEIGGGDGGSIVLPTVTVTADALLAGVTAINSNGDVVTGNIPTVEAFRSGSVITVPAGNIAVEQTFDVGVELPAANFTAADLRINKTAIDGSGKQIVGTMPDVSLGRSKNVISIGTGYSAGGKVTIPLVELAKSGNIVSIQEGYTLGGSIIVEVETVAATLERSGNIITITAGIIEAQIVEIPKVTPQLNDNVFTVDEGYVNSTEMNVPVAQSVSHATGFTVEYTSGYLPNGIKVTAPEAVVNETDTQVSVGRGWIEEEKSFSKSITLPEVNFMSYGLREDMSALDSNGNVVQGTAPFVVSDDYSISFTQNGSRVELGILPQVTGFVHSGDYFTKELTLEIMDFACVLQYTAPHDAYSAVSSIEVSGFGEAETWDGATDFSAWNGTYNVTSETSAETGTEKRIFKHSTENKYLFRMYCNDNSEYYWVFNTSPSADYVYEADFHADTLASGTWRNYEYEFEVTLSLNQISTDYPAQEEVLYCLQAEYIKSIGWSLNNPITVNSFERTPLKNGIYALSDKKLIGEPVAYHADLYIPIDGLLMYFPMYDSGDVAVDVIGGLRLKKHGKSVVATGDYWQNTATTNCYLAGINTSFDLPEAFTLSAYVNYQGQEGRRHLIPVIDFGTAEDDSGFGIRVNGDASTVAYGLRIGSDENGTHLTGIPANEWHQITFTWIKNSGGSYDAKGYLDGVQKYSYTWDSYYTPANSIKISMFGRGCFESSKASTICEIGAVMLWNRVLTEDEIASFVPQQ